MAVLPTPEFDPDSDSDPEFRPVPDGELSDSLELVRKAKEGDDSAFSELLNRYYLRMLPFVRSRFNADLRTQMESGDALHEAMLNAIKGFEHFQVRSNKELAAWFMRVIENYLISAARAARAQKRDRDREVPLDGAKSDPDDSAPRAPPADPAAGPLDLTAQHEQNRIYLECLEALEPEQRQVIQLRHGTNQSWADIAQTMERSPDAARMLYGRALVQLQKIMRRRGLDSTS
jgi:RNA polymerase sigma-70 factor (ECF subfamily)